MRASDVATIRREALRVLVNVDPRLLWLVIAEQRSGYPTGGSGIAAGSAESTSTERAALNSDAAADALADLATVMRLLSRAAADLDRMFAMWATPARPATCEHCRGPTGERYRRICRFCTEWLSRHGEFPTPQQIARREMGGRNRHPAPHA